MADTEVLGDAFYYLVFWNEESQSAPIRPTGTFPHEWEKGGNTKFVVLSLPHSWGRWP